MNAREKLIKTGACLFAKKSFIEVTVEDVVNKAKLSKGAFYHYFSSKEDFYIEIIKEADRVFQQIFMENLTKNIDVKEKLRIFIESALMFFQKEKNLYLVVQNEINKMVAGASTPFYHFQQEMLARIRNFLPENSDLFLPYLIMGVLRSAVIFKVQNRISDDELIDKVWRYVSRSVAV